MNIPKYEKITKSPNFEIFDFVSKGPKGNIEKRIQFNETNTPFVYNLGFGDKIEDGDIDDIINSNNDDRDIILATVVSAVYDFTNIYPERFVIFFGSNDIRTRLYRMAISKNLEFLKKDFHIFALLIINDEFVSVPFEKEINSAGFLVKRKVIKQ